MFRVFIAALTLGALAASCREKPADETLSPPETPLFLKEGIGYGVVTVSFANVLEEPRPAAVSTGLIRRGSVVVAVECRALPLEENSNGAARLWVFVETRPEEDNSAETRPVAGWLPEDHVDFYASLPKAETASKRMR
jgi:hypothetical protein